MKDTSIKKLLTSRRALLTGFAALATGACALRVANAGRTPSATPGPYYPGPAMRKPDIDNDLVKIEGQVQEAGGEIITLRGTLRDRDGQVLAGHRVEIWQCDVNGKYLHHSDTRAVARDEAFQGFGFDVTDDNGQYVFRTIKPTVYPGRTPHIHVRVWRGNRKLLTTQFYLKDDPRNGDDWIYRKMNDEQANSVSMAFVDGDDGLETTVDMVV